MLHVKCADCGCFPDECKQSTSPKDCPNCTWGECCCWFELHPEHRSIKRCMSCGREFEIWCRYCN